ncbi:peroxisome biogenesis protein 6 [Pyrus ussuriensis x Pyrus communis]|uniref:Peroxisome biogenesis protein 6 n=1 Tax=Pyrus ussuriensis x Pyrus communis TaxID=2448454 RepID=A0A5N5GSM8_9ROSA|nr:peroxisome biogenesis protein 6 [Pyrus ussuriensis x Pyrus communis]
MVERRRRNPLVLTFTKNLINSVLSEGHRVDGNGDGDASTSFQLPPGFLRLSKDSPKLASLDDSALVGLSTPALKRLSITSGSLVIVKNVETNIQRTAQAIVLDPPNNRDFAAKIEQSLSEFSHAMLVLPCCAFPENDRMSLKREVAYISPLLAFNLDLHTLVDDEVSGKDVEASVVGLQLEPQAQLPRYTSHLRAAFVKIPEFTNLTRTTQIPNLIQEQYLRSFLTAFSEYLRGILKSTILQMEYPIRIGMYHGGTGRGKRTVVRYIARRSGLHVVEYSCHNLMASSEKRMSVLLAQTLNTAQRYSPAILILRHFDVFRNLGSQEGLPGDQVGITSEMASLIKEFTEPISDDGDMDSEGKHNGDIDAGKRRRVLLIAAADSSQGLPPTIRCCFSHEISMGPLTEEQRTGSEEFIKDIVEQTSGFMPRDIRALIADAGAKLISRGNVPMNTVKSEESDGSLRSYVESDSKSSEVAPQFLGKENLTKALERSKKRKASALGTPKVI